MSPHEKHAVTSEDVISRIKSEIASPSRGQTTSSVASRMARIQGMQRDYRIEPLGGRLLPIKKAFHWLVASAFDRQAKVVESLLFVVDDLSDTIQRMSQSMSDLENELAVARRSQVRRGSQFSPAHSVAVATDDPNLAASITDVLHACAEMMEPERVLLYALVFALKPSYCLEIGTFRGGSTSIICKALDDIGHGLLVCVDPEPRIPDDVWENIRHRATLIQGSSPEALDQARGAVPGEFHLALIDGDHSFEGALNDIEGVLEHIEDGAHIVLHDCHFFEVKDAIHEALRRHPDTLIDCGVISVTQNPQHGEGSVVDGKQVIWGGLHLLRYKGPA